jgi:hypothetical protein
MRSAPACLGLGLLLITASCLRADDKAPKDKDAPPADKLIPIAQVVAVVQTVNESDGILTIRITTKYLEPNVQAQANLLKEEQQLVTRAQAAALIRNPLQRQQEFLKVLQSARDMQLHPQNLFTVKEVQNNVDLSLTDDTKVRTARPAAAFDDKGDPKIYTAQELKDLKGTDNLPGFPAERDALKNGQTVLVLAARKHVVQLNAAKGPDGKPAPDPAKESMADDKKPIAAIVLIAADGK